MAKHFERFWYTNISGNTKRYIEENHPANPEHVKVGNGFIVGMYTVIGKDGFTINYDPAGQPKVIPNLGSIKIGNNVQIGSHCTVCRGTTGETIIGNNVKIDDHVHISHNVVIEDNVVIGAGAIVGGSTVIKEGATVKMGEIIPSHSIIYPSDDKNVCDTIKGVKTKLIIVDLDNTLWGGVVGDDGPDNIKFEKEHIELQNKLKKLSQRGVLLAICSKNNMHNVQYAFQRKEMVLSIDDFVTTRINWESKAFNIKSILQELNLSQNGVVFIDDNPVERNQILTELPDIQTITEEDAARLNLYKTEASRQKAKAKYKTHQEWLDALNLHMRIRPMREDEITRVDQLLNRTNQMFCGKRVSKKELLKDNNIFIVKLSDSFGDYGIVGVIRLNNSGVSNFVLSCRAMGRGVEDEMFKYIDDWFNEKEYSFDFEFSGENEPLLKAMVIYYKERFDIDNKMIIKKENK